MASPQHLVVKPRKEIGKKIHTPAPRALLEEIDACFRLFLQHLHFMSFFSNSPSPANQKHQASEMCKRHGDYNWSDYSPVQIFRGIEGKSTRARESLFGGGNLFPLFCLLFEFSTRSSISHNFLSDVFV